MNVIVDYLSISIKYPRFYTWVKSDETAHVKSELMSRFRKLFNLINDSEDLVQMGGRAPFDVSYHSPSRGFTYFESTKLSTSLIEITGHGCEFLRQSGWLEAIMRDFVEDLTRIDVACDIETDLEPDIFCSEREIGRFQAYAIQNSTSGKSCYIGSKTSSRYGRVYRYRTPHPRANLLRIEHVCKGEYATQCAKSVLDDGIKKTAIMLGVSFGWKHDVWKVSIGGETQIKPFRSVVRETRQGSTDRWLLKAVIPALKKMVKNGKRDMVVYFVKQVIAILEEKS